MTELDKLIDAVERGVDTAHHHAAAFPSESAYGKCKWHDSHKASSGSLDAAKALHDALLDSGFHAEIQACCTRPRVRVVRGDEVHDGNEQESESCSWLIATLKAYRHSKNAHSSVHQRTP